MRSHGPSGIGVDIVEISRVRKIRFLDRFAEYFLVSSELKDFRNSPDPLRFVASRFAAKEAVIKAFPGQIGPREFEVAKKDKKPVVRFLSENHKKYRALLSLSHSTEYAAGYAAVYAR